MNPGLPLVIRVVDLETTGNSFTDGGVVEVGWQDLEADVGESWRLASAAPCATLVRPPHPISAATSAIHHIVDEDVADAPAWPDASKPVLLPGTDRRIVAFAAHRAAFEQRWCGALAAGTGWICTWKCALRIWPDAPTHSNQGLRYWRRPDGLDRATALPAHRAGPDAYVTAHHLRDLLGHASVAELLAWSAEPALLIRVPFGPFRGRSWSDLDDETLARLASGEAGGNADVRFTAGRELKRRSGERGPGPVTAVDPGQPRLPFERSDTVSP